MKKNSFYVRTMKRNMSETCNLFFSTLSNPTRLGILELLREAPRDVTTIAEALNQEQSMISHNLKTLVRCRFVFVEKRWRNHVYSLNRETMEPIFKIIDNHAEKYCPYKGECLSVEKKRR